MHISLAPQFLPYNILLNQIFIETSTENNSLAISETFSPANTSLWKNCDKLMGHSQMGLPEQELAPAWGRSIPTHPQMQY